MFSIYIIFRHLLFRTLFAAAHHAHAVRLPVLPNAARRRH